MLDLHREHSTYRAGRYATVLGAPLSVDARIAAYRAVQRSDIKRVAAKYFDKGRRSVVIVRPERRP